jgi:hypothetical protein
MKEEQDEDRIVQVQYIDPVANGVNGTSLENDKLSTERLGQEIDPQAVGGSFSDLPKGYYISPSFLGTFMAVGLGTACHYLGFVLPANTISIINEDIGE